ncbi:MAG TPA: ATP-binding protein [Candidatus Krumholzibacteria bacterium]|nr:ATP-binding protein [Candidatus Krumholzibacteria bacterium]
MGNSGDQMILNIPSDLKYLGAVDAAIQDLAREFSFSQDAINDVSTALIEACSNAIEHGNRFARDKRVVVTLRFNSNSFSASVKDEGPGFDFQSAVDGNNTPDPMSERGRGLMIMQAFTDSLNFRYADGGLYVELTKTRGDEGPEEEA